MNVSNMEDKKAFQLTDEDLTNAGLLGDGAFGSVIHTIETIKKHPKLLSELTLFMLECQNMCGLRQILDSTSAILSDASTIFSKLSIPLDPTIISPHSVSEYERTTYYYGISFNPPELLYRSDILTNPFPIPKGRFPHVGTKTAHGVFGTMLNPVWDTVAPKIVTLLKDRSIRYSAVKAARFSTLGEDGKEILGPVVIWIATHPTTTTAENAYDASPAILDLLKAYEVKGVVVEWYEGVVERLAGPALLHVTSDINPTCCVRRPFTAGLGMPIATKERDSVDAQGSVAFFFHESKTKHGEPSARVLGVSNAHVLRKNTTVDYEFKSAGSVRLYVRLAGFRRFQRALDEIKTLIAKNVTDANYLALEIVRLEQKPQSEDPEEDEKALRICQDQLTKVNQDNIDLEKFFKQINTQWNDIPRRNIGFVDWVPKISIDVNGHQYTKDIGTFELDEPKFKAQFKGNIVDLGFKYTPYNLVNKFYPDSNSRMVFKFPFNRQLRIKGCVPPKLLASPNCYDCNGEPCLIVMKDGNTTDLTVGRYAGLEAYICNEFGIESIELAIYNYDLHSDSFSAKGDSGSLIFAGDGSMVGILHSGMLKGGSSHVTYATPAWWVIEQIKHRYPYADFNRTTF